MSLPLSATVIPGGGFPIANDSDLAGGYASVANEAAIGAIVAGSLKIGMQRYSQSSGITYQLTSLTPANSFANGTWSPLSAPAGAGQWVGCQLASTGNVAALSGEQTIDGVLTSNSRILLWQQTTASQNGIWNTSSGAWSRPSDANTAGAFSYGKTVGILAGSTLAGAIFLNNVEPTTVGTDAIGFVENAGTGSAPTVTLAGDVTGPTGTTVVAAVHGASVPAAGALTTGNGLRVTGASSLGYAALNLAGGAGWVSGVLPAANQAAQALGGDASGTTAAATIVQITGPAGNATLPVLAASEHWTPSGVANFDVFRTPYAVQTTDATLTTIATIATTAGDCYRVDVVAQTRLNAAGDAYSNTASAFFTNNAGTLTEQGGTLTGTPLGTTTGAAWPGLSITSSGTSILVQVQGAAATTINWRGDVRLTRTS